MGRRRDGGIEVSRGSPRLCVCDGGTFGPIRNRYRSTADGNDYTRAFEIVLVCASRGATLMDSPAIEEGWTFVP